MTDEDLKKFKQMFKEELSLTEQRLEQSFEKRLGERLSIFEEKITGKITQLSHDIGDYIEKTLNPMLDEKANKTDLSRTEARVASIESTPTVAHELRSEKH